MRKTVANEIFRQLGGQRFVAMTGANRFIDMTKETCGIDGIRMKIGRNKTNANFFEVVLNSMDTYDVCFAKLTSLGEYKSVKEYKNVYNDSLVSLFESHTGMYTSL